MPTTTASTQQLSDLLAAVDDLPDQATVVHIALEHVARALDAEVVALVVDREVVLSLGMDEDSSHVEALLQVVHGTDSHLDVAGAGRCATLSEPCQAMPGSTLVVARSAGPFDDDEQGLLRGMTRVLSLAVQARRLVDGERSQREASDAQVTDNVRLLASLGERQVLLERLSRIQRSISSRQPLHEVLDAIVAGAADLIGDDIVGLRLLDPHDPGLMVLASSIGVPDHLAAQTLRLPLGSGVGGRALVENALVHTDDYASVPAPLPGYADDGVRSAMAAPVRQGDRAVGSLVVATRRPGRTYSASEQEALTAFAEHVGLALNDAHSVAALHQAVADATHQSRHDGLTGLPNRAMFLEELAQASADDFFTGEQPMAVLFVDLDDFKLVNDSLGHLVGDQLLSAVARRVVQGVRTPDVVARLGGDEFAVLMQSTHQDEAESVAQRVLDLLAEPFSVDGHTLHVRASIGLVSSGRGWARPEELLRDADVAMYRAKAEGKHRFVVFAPEMRDALQARSALEADLRRAVERGQFTVDHQPVLDAATGRVTSTEALLRWDNARLGRLSAGQFMTLAEDTGLVAGMGAEVLRQACLQTARWREQPELAALTVSVNVSSRQLREPDLVALVRQVLDDTGLPASALLLELHESVLVDGAVELEARLAELKAVGVRLALDDFGTGSCSLSRLAQLPVDVLKVDRSFVAGIGDGSRGRLAWTVLALADALGLEAVAEGVETHAQERALVERGCTTLQGYLYSPPVPAAALPAAVARIEAYYPAMNDSRTWRTGLSTLTSTSATDCQVPSASVDRRTGTQA